MGPADPRQCSSKPTLPIGTKEGNLVAVREFELPGLASRRQFAVFLAPLHLLLRQNDFVGILHDAVMRRCALSCNRSNGRLNGSSLITTSYSSRTQLYAVSDIAQAPTQILRSVLPGNQLVTDKKVADDMTCNIWIFGQPPHRVFEP